MRRAIGKTGLFRREIMKEKVEMRVGLTRTGARRPRAMTAKNFMAKLGMARDV